MTTPTSLEPKVSGSVPRAAWLLQDGFYVLLSWKTSEVATRPQSSPLRLPNLRRTNQWVCTVAAKLSLKTMALQVSSKCHDSAVRVLLNIFGRFIENVPLFGSRSIIVSLIAQSKTSQLRFFGNRDFRYFPQSRAQRTLCSWYFFLIFCLESVEQNFGFRSKTSSVRHGSRQIQKLPF